MAENVNLPATIDPNSLQLDLQGPIGYDKGTEWVLSPRSVQNELENDELQPDDDPMEPVPGVLAPINDVTSKQLSNPANPHSDAAADESTTKHKGKGKEKAIEPDDDGLELPGVAGDEIVSDSEEEPYEIDLPGHEEYPGDLSTTGEDGPNYIIRESDKEFIERIHRNGDEDNDEVFEKWRTPYDEQGVYQWPWQTPYFTETPENPVRYLYGTNPIIVLQMEGEDELGLGILRDTCAYPLSNDALLLVEWLYTGRQLREEVRNLQGRNNEPVDAATKEKYLKRFNRLKLEDKPLHESTELIASNHLQIVDQGTMLGPLLPPTHEDCQTIRWFVDVSTYIVKESQPIRTSECAVPHRLLDHGEFGISKRMSWQQYQKIFGQYLKIITAGNKGITTRLLFRAKYAMWMCPRVAKWAELMQASLKRYHEAKEKVTHLSAELKKVDMEIKALKNRRTTRAGKKTPSASLAGSSQAGPSQPPQPATQTQSGSVDADARGGNGEVAEKLITPNEAMEQ